MSKVEVDFGGWFSKAFELYKKNFVTLLLASLIASLLGSLTIGVLMGPLYVGLFAVTLGLLDGAVPAPQPGDVFKGLQKFLPAFLVALVMGAIYLVSFIIPFIGPLLALAGLVLFFFAFPLLADGRATEVGDALKQSMEAVKQNYLPLLALFLVGGIVSGLGAILCGIGVIVTAPIGACVIAVAYRAHFPRTGNIGAVTVPPPAA